MSVKHAVTAGIMRKRRGVIATSTSGYSLLIFGAKIGNMTNLTKTVKRVSAGLVHEAGNTRQIIIILQPPDVIGFRAMGCRKEYRLSAAGCYTMAVRAYVLAAKREKVKQRKVRKNEQKRI